MGAISEKGLEQAVNGYKPIECRCPDGQFHKILVPEESDASMFRNLSQGSISGMCGYADEKDAWSLFHSIGKALIYLAQNNLFHSQISTENIFLGNDNGMFLEYRHISKGKQDIEQSYGSDSMFGSLSSIRDFVSSSMRDREEESGYQQKAEDRSSITVQDEVWSLGAAVFHLLMGVKVFNGQGAKAQCRTTPVPCFNTNIYSAELCELTKRCLSYAPDDRPSLEEIVRLSEEALDKYEDKPRQIKKIADKIPTINEVIAYWPEKMEN